MTAILSGVALQELWSLVGTAEKALIAVSLMVVVTAILGMVTMIPATLNERRREVAILCSVGAGPKTVIGLLVSEAAILTLLGVLVGVVALYGLLLGLRPEIDAAYGLYLDIEPPSRTERRKQHWDIKESQQVTCHMLRLLIRLTRGWIDSERRLARPIAKGAVVGTSIFLTDRNGQRMAESLSPNIKARSFEFGSYAACSCSRQMGQRPAKLKEMLPSCPQHLHCTECPNIVSARSVFWACIRSDNYKHVILGG